MSGSLSLTTAMWLFMLRRFKMLFKMLFVVHLSEAFEDPHVLPLQFVIDILGTISPIILAPVFPAPPTADLFGFVLDITIY